ncbi:MAG TPA: SDR family oxidoreductase [Candidatus Paceibacterota bacterium]|nr:SDR family oxidoreductase [Candidatus Paceibacterota bacterium]
MLKEKRVLVTGVLNEHSICWAIAHRLAQQGAEVVMVGQSENIVTKRLRPLIAESGLTNITPDFCDVEDAAQVAALFERLGSVGKFDGLIHGPAYSDRTQMKGRAIDVTRDNFARTMLVSAYSFLEFIRGIESMMNDGGSIACLTFDASNRPVPNYFCMGFAKAALESITRYAACDLGRRQIRVNAISPSPENTTSARQVSRFYLVGDFAEAMAPMQRRATLDEIADQALYLMSSLSTAVTGQILRVDCGASMVGIPPLANAPSMHAAMGKVVRDV